MPPWTLTTRTTIGKSLILRSPLGFGAHWSSLECLIWRALQPYLKSFDARIIDLWRLSHETKRNISKNGVAKWKRLFLYFYLQSLVFIYSWENLPHSLLTCVDMWLRLLHYSVSVSFLPGPQLFDGAEAQWWLILEFIQIKLKSRLTQTVKI